MNNDIYKEDFVLSQYNRYPVCVWVIILLDGISVFLLGTHAKKHNVVVERISYLNETLG